MTTTFIKMTDVPTYPTTAMTATPVATHTGDVLWKRVDTVKVYLSGNLSATDEPRKALTDWLTTNNEAIAKNGLRPLLTVSSWAVVVDITWKSAFNAVRQINNVSDSLTPQSPATAGNYQAVGATGDTIGVKLSVKNSAY